MGLHVASTAECTSLRDSVKVRLADGPEIVLETSRVKELYKYHLSHVSNRLRTPGSDLEISGVAPTKRAKNRKDFPEP